MYSKPYTRCDHPQKENTDCAFSSNENEEQAKMNMYRIIISVDNLPLCTGLRLAPSTHRGTIDRYLLQGLVHEPQTNRLGVASNAPTAQHNTPVLEDPICTLPAPSPQFFAFVRERCRRHTRLAGTVAAVPARSCLSQGLVGWRLSQSRLGSRRQIEPVGSIL